MNRESGAEIQLCSVYISPEERCDYLHFMNNNKIQDIIYPHTHMSAVTYECSALLYVMESNHKSGW